MEKAIVMAAALLAFTLENARAFNFTEADLTCFHWSLKQPDIEYVRDFEPDSERCLIEEPMRVTAFSAPLSQPATLACQTVRQLSPFLGDDLQDIARRHVGAKVTRIYSGPGYDCRTVYRKKGGRLSGHALGNALDIRAFAFADDQIIRVTDWGKDPVKTAFLRAVRDRACAAVTMTLGPEYNAAHGDHFHFENSPFNICE